MKEIRLESRTLGPEYGHQDLESMFRKTVMTFKRMFGAQFVEIENSIDPNSPNEDLKTAQAKKLLPHQRSLEAWINREPTTFYLQRWVKSEDG